MGMCTNVFWCFSIKQFFFEATNMGIPRNVRWKTVLFQFGLELFFDCFLAWRFVFWVVMAGFWMCQRCAYMLFVFQLSWDFCFGVLCQMFSALVHSCVFGIFGCDVFCIWQSKLSLEI